MNDLTIACALSTQLVSLPPFERGPDPIYLKDLQRVTKVGEASGGNGSESKLNELVKNCDLNLAF